MASGPTAHPARLRAVLPARPGALLASAAAVPLGAATLYAAGLLEWGPRLALGLALLVLGVAIRRTAGTVTGARIGPAASRAIGLAVIVGGALAIGGALAATVVDRNPDAEWASLLPCAALGAAGVWIGRDRPAVGGVLAALAAGVGWMLLLVVLDVGAQLEIVATVLPAFGLTLAALRGAGSPALRAGLGTAAATILIGGTGEVTGVSLVLRGLLLPTGSPDPAIGWFVAQAIVSRLLLGVLLATAFVRRDPAGGALAATALLAPAFGDDIALRIGQGIVPALAVVLLSAALWSPGLRGWLTSAVPVALRDAGWNVTPERVRAAWVVALVVAVASVSIDDSRVLAALAVGALLVATWEAWSGRATTASRVAAVTLVAWTTIQPFLVLLGDRRDVAVSFPGEAASDVPVDPTTTAALVGLAVVVVVALGLLTRIRTAAVAAAATFAVASASSMAILVGVGSDGQLARYLAGAVAVDVLLLVVAAVLAAVGPRRWVAHAQAAGAAVAGRAVVVALMLPTLVLGTVFADGQELTDLVRLILVLLLVGIGFGGALLAASTARRTSTVAALGAVGAAVATAMVAATLSAAIAGPPDPAGPIDSAAELSAPLSLVLGFDWRGGLLQFGDGVWPVLLGVVGAVLLAAAAWLESRRPLPAGAPLAPRDDD